MLMLSCSAPSRHTAGPSSHRNVTQAAPPMPADGHRRRGRLLERLRRRLVRHVPVLVQRAFTSSTTARVNPPLAASPRPGLTYNASTRASKRHRSPSSPSFSLMQPAPLQIRRVYGRVPPQQRHQPPRPTGCISTSSALPHIRITAVDLVRHRPNPAGSPRPASVYSTLQHLTLDPGSSSGMVGHSNALSPAGARRTLPPYSLGHP